MNFGQAIEAAKQGKKIRREAWSGAGQVQYVALVTGICYLDTAGNTVQVESKAGTAFAVVDRTGIRLNWMANQSDMMAEDWVAE